MQVWVYCLVARYRRSSGGGKGIVESGWPRGCFHVHSCSQRMVLERTNSERPSVQARRQRCEHDASLCGAKSSFPACRLADTAASMMDCFLRQLITFPCRQCCDHDERLFEATGPFSPCRPADSIPVLQTLWVGVPHDWTGVLNWYATGRRHFGLSSNISDSKE
eukprot:1053074-Pelagomonas_calceolata.AAC.2